MKRKEKDEKKREERRKNKNVWCITPFAMNTLGHDHSLSLPSKMVLDGYKQSMRNIGIFQDYIRVSDWLYLHILN